MRQRAPALVKSDLCAYVVWSGLLVPRWLVLVIGLVRDNEAIIGKDLIVG